MSNSAWVTLTTNDAYSLGALVLAHSLKRVGTVHQLVVLVTPTVSEAMRSKLREVYNLVQEVNVLDSKDAANLALLARPELGVTFTKLHAWRLVQFEKCVFLDSDILVLQNADELFEREELSAAPDVSWPDCFNSGVFVYRPSEATFSSIIEFALQNGSFDGGDQGVLNSYFSDWAHKDISKHLPFTYNTTAFASYSYLPAFKQFRDKIKILHFAGKLKPWLLNFNSENKTAYVPSEFQHAADLVQLWWNIFCDNVHQSLSDQMHNYWPKMDPQSVTSSSENHHHHHHHHHHHNHTYDSSSLNNNETNYDSGNFFDDIQPYHDPWEDYYEKLEKLNEQNSSNNNATSDSTTNTPSPPQIQSAIEAAEPNHDFIVLSSHSESPESDQSQPPPPHHDEIHQFSETSSPSSSEEISHDSVTTPQQMPTNFFENIVYNFETQQQVAIDRTMGVNRSTSDSNKSISEKELNTALNNLLLETSDENDVDTSNLDSNSISNLNSNTNEDSATEAGLAGALAKVRLGEPRTTEQEAYEASMRRQCWEAGNIDYSGKDSFDNIWKKISQTLDSKPVAEAAEKPSGSK